MTRTERWDHFFTEDLRKLIDDFDLTGEIVSDSKGMLDACLEFFEEEQNFPNIGVNNLMKRLREKIQRGSVDVVVGTFLNVPARPSAFFNREARAWTLQLPDEFISGMLDKTAEEWGAVVNTAQQLEMLMDPRTYSGVSPLLLKYIPQQASTIGHEMEASFLLTWKDLDITFEPSRSQRFSMDRIQKRTQH